MYTYIQTHAYMHTHIHTHTHTYTHTHTHIHTYMYKMTHFGFLKVEKLDTGGTTDCSLGDKAVGDMIPTFLTIVP